VKIHEHHPSPGLQSRSLDVEPEEVHATVTTMVGGTVLTGGGWISLSACWESVVRGLFLVTVVVINARLVGCPVQTR